MPKKTPTKKSRGQQVISRKISYLVEREGLSQRHAVGKAHGMARSGDLGPSAKAAAGSAPKKRKKR